MCPYPVKREVTGSRTFFVKEIICSGVLNVQTILLPWTWRGSPLHNFEPTTEKALSPPCISWPQVALGAENCSLSYSEICLCSVETKCTKVKSVWPVLLLIFDKGMRKTVLSAYRYDFLCPCYCFSYVLVCACFLQIGSYTFSFSISLEQTGA